MDNSDRTAAAAFVGGVSTILVALVCWNMPWPVPINLFPAIPIAMLAFAALYNIGARL